MAASFNGGKLLSNIANFPNTEAAKSLSFWFTLATVTGTQSFINATNLSSFGYQIGFRTNQIAVWSHGGTALVAFNQAAVITELAHLVYVYDPTLVSGKHKLYLNNALMASADVATQIGAPTVCEVGNNNWAEALSNGSILDDMRVYDRILTANEVATIYNARGSDRIIDCVARWKFDEGVVGAALVPIDSGKSKLPAVLTGSPVYAQSKLQLKR